MPTHPDQSKRARGSARKRRKAPEPAEKTLPADALYFRWLREEVLDWTRPHTANVLGVKSTTTLANWELGKNDKGVPLWAIAMLEEERDKMQPEDPERRLRMVPILGKILAGVGGLAAQRHMGAIEWEKRNPGNVFALVVVGDSMKESNFKEGDIAIFVEGPATAPAVVAARIGEEATIKHLVMREGQPTLEGDTGPVPIPKGQRFEVLGEVVDLIRP